MRKTDSNNWFRKSDSGLYELYAEGEPYALGASIGKLTHELIGLQEDYFNEQIRRLVPSRFYLHFLKYLIRWFNRRLARNIPEEYREEIRGISGYASDRYGYIGGKYERILNYHAAHDIGHALQNLALVGCSSFGTWGAKSRDRQLIIGRNFDFYAGDAFAENKIVAFIRPKAGYRFMSVTWGGFTGVVSGMNERGLTVTINAAKSAIPRGSATPVSLVAREILQYAATISEAYAIAGKRKMFVSESFLIGSAADGRAAIIEKTPGSLDLYDPGQESIVCTNHFQGPGLGRSALNREQMDRSASVYRARRLTELLETAGPNTVQQTVDILRDRRGLDGRDIGMGNEKSVNQLIAHHSIVFEPAALRVWVSTAPWQLGRYVAYDLHKVFALEEEQNDAAGRPQGNMEIQGGLRADREIYERDAEIGADPFLSSPQYDDFMAYQALRQQMEDGAAAGLAGDSAAAYPDRLVARNPQLYHAYVLAGNYLFKQKAYARALPFYETALTREIATMQEEEYILKQIKKCRP
jgi:isopenicillin-N N-acyltransferase-like protein